MSSTIHRCLLLRGSMYIQCTQHKLFHSLSMKWGAKDMVHKQNSHILLSFTGLENKNCACIFVHIQMDRLLEQGIKMRTKNTDKERGKVKKARIKVPMVIGCGTTTAAKNGEKKVKSWVGTLWAMYLFKLRTQSCLLSFIASFYSVIYTDTHI